FNVFFLLTFPLTAVIALFVLRRFAVSYGPALIASLLYAFLPYHLLRNCQLFFAAYYHVPLMVLVIVWLQRDGFLLDRAGEKPRLCWRSGKFLGSMLICVLMSCGGVYYAFFGCAFLLVAGVMAALSRKAAAPLWAGGILCTVIVLGGLVNGIPYLQARLENGKNA